MTSKKKKRKPVTIKQVRQKMLTMGIQGGYNWQDVTPEQHMANLNFIQRKQRLRRKNIKLPRP